MLNQEMTIEMPTLTFRSLAGFDREDGVGKTCPPYELLLRFEFGIADPSPDGLSASGFDRIILVTALPGSLTDDDPAPK